MGPALGVRPPPHNGICQTTRNSSEILKERVPGNQCRKPGVFGEQEADRLLFGGGPANWKRALFQEPSERLVGD